MSPERNRGFFENSWYKLVRTSVLAQAELFNKSFRIVEKLGLDPQSAEVFKIYFAGYYAQREGVRLPSFVSVLNSPMYMRLRRYSFIDRIYGVLETMIETNNQVGDELIQSARKQAMDINLADTSPEATGSAAHLLVAIYLNGSYTKRSQQTEAIDQACVRINIGRNRFN